MSVSIYVAGSEEVSDLQELNLANGNFMLLMRALGRVDADWVGRLQTAAEIQALRDEALILRDVDVIGLPAGYMREVVDVLLPIIDRALATGKPLCWS